MCLAIISEEEQLLHTHSLQKKGIMLTWYYKKASWYFISVILLTVCGVFFILDAEAGGDQPPFLWKRLLYTATLSSSFTLIIVAILYFTLPRDQERETTIFTRHLSSHAAPMAER